MSKPVMAGITSTHGVMLNDDCNAVMISIDCEVSVIDENNPTPA